MCEGLAERRRDEHDRRVVWIGLTEVGAKRGGELLGRMRHYFPDQHPAEVDPEAQGEIRGYLIHLITTGRGADEERA